MTLAGATCRQACAHGLSPRRRPSCTVLTFKEAVQLPVPAVQVVTGAEAAAEAGDDHGHKQGHSGGDACQGLGT